MATATVPSAATSNAAAATTVAATSASSCAADGSSGDKGGSYVCIRGIHRIYARIRMFPTYALHTRMYKGDRSD